MPKIVQTNKKSPVQKALKIHQSELAETCTAYQQLLNSKLIGITISDSYEKILAANDCFLEMLGYTREDFNKGLVTWPSITSQKFDETDEEIVSELFENKVVHSVEKEYIHKDGHSVPVIAGAELLEECAPLNISYAFRIRHQTGVERERDQFIRTVRHELKTPLAVMKMQAELMRSELPKDAIGKALRSYVREIENQITHVQAMLNDVFNTYQYANENISYPKSYIDIQKLVMEVVENAALISGRRITLKTVRQPCIIRGNKARKRQVIINILNNAIKYSPEDTHIDVQIKRDEETVRIAVTDHGRGIPKSEQKKIFQQSYRVRNTGTADSDSSGIGLHLCALIMRQSGGFIEVESKPRKGSTFTIVMPLADSSSQ